MTDNDEQQQQQEDRAENRDAYTLSEIQNNYGEEQATRNDENAKTGYITPAGRRIRPPV
jgi:hypothetical protein